MHNWLFIIALLVSTSCQSEPYKLSESSTYNDIINRAAESGEPLLMMPLSIISRPEEQQLEISYNSHNGSMIVNGKVNGFPMRFVVDTGASLVTIPSSIAKKAGISTSDSRQIKLQTANGAITAPLVKLDQVIADNIAITEVMAVVQDVSPAPDLGLLGMSFFGQHRITIDHQRSVIILEPK